MQPPLHTLSLFGLGLALAACSSTSSGSTDAPDATADVVTVGDGATTDAPSTHPADGGGDARSPIVDASGDADGGYSGGSCMVPTTPVGTGTLTGTIHGGPPLTVADVSVLLSRTSPGAGPWILRIGFHDYAHACGYSEQGSALAGSNTDWIIIQTSSEAVTSPFRIGTYTQSGLTEEDAGSYTYDISLGTDSLGGTCANNSSRGSVNGTVTLTNAGPTQVTGSYDLAFPNGHITGQFDAPVCIPAALGTTIACCGEVDGGASDAATDH